jgi:hypothetical protein
VENSLHQLPRIGKLMQSFLPNLNKNLCTGVDVQPAGSISIDFGDRQVAGAVDKGD